jgi:hypothetical protein
MQTGAEFQQIKKAYWIRLITRREMRDTLQSRHMTLTSNLKKAQAALDAAQLAYDNLKPSPDDSAVNESRK